MSRLYSPSLAALALLLTLSACRSYGGESASGALHASTDSASIDSIASSLFALDLAPGMSVAVVRGDEVLYLGGFGWADREDGRRVGPETIFYIASTTKAFTGLTAAILDDRGRFDLDTPVSRWLPDAKLRAPLSADSITIRSLLSHTHGIGNSGPIVWRTAYTGDFSGNDELVRLLSEHPPSREGRAYVYGNIGYNVAGIAMDRALGRSWRDVLADEILRPLDMTSTSAYVSRVPAERLAMPYQVMPTGFERIPYGKADANMQAAGGLVSSARDLARWLEAQLNAGRVDGRQRLSAAAVAEAQRMQATTNADRRGMRQVGYSLGWQVTLRGDDTLYIHGGGFAGFAALVSFLPRHRIGVAVMANESALGPALTEAVTRGIYARLAGPASGADIPANFGAELARAREGIMADRARRAARPQVLPFPLAAYAGVYDNPQYGAIELNIVEGRLAARAGAARSLVEVFDGERNQLRVELTGGGSVMTVEFENGRAMRLQFSGQTFERRAGPG